MEKSIKSLTIDSKGKQLDFTLLFVVLLILCVGLIVLSSASSYYALTEFNDSSYYLKRQIFFSIVGVISMIIISKIDYKIYSTKLGYLLYALGIGMMWLVFVPRYR
jgi:cell division protein FtsW